MEKEVSFDEWGIGYKGEYILGWKDVYDSAYKCVKDVEKSSCVVDHLIPKLKDMFKKAGFKLKEII